MELERTYLIRKEIDLDLDFLFLANIAVEKLEIEKFSVFQDTSDDVIYSSINKSRYP